MDIVERAEQLLGLDEGRGKFHSLMTSNGFKVKEQDHQITTYHKKVGDQEHEVHIHKNERWSHIIDGLHKDSGSGLDMLSDHFASLKRESDDEGILKVANNPPKSVKPEHYQIWKIITLKGNHSDYGGAMAHFKRHMFKHGTVGASKMAVETYEMFHPGTKVRIKGGSTATVVKQDSYNAQYPRITVVRHDNGQQETHNAEVLTRESTIDANPSLFESNFDVNNLLSEGYEDGTPSINSVTREQELVQYQNVKNNFHPAGKINLVPTLPAGIYEVNWQPGGYYFSRKDIKSDEILKFEDSRYNKVITEVRKFWTQYEDFNKIGFAHKRGALLFGDPGTGKSCILKQIMDESVQEGHLVFVTKNASGLMGGIQAVREVEPKRNILVVIEDIDELVSYGEHSMLQLFDGDNQTDRVMFLATTNYIDRIPARMLRTGRFDTKMEVFNPPANGRRAYFQHKLPNETSERIEQLVTATEDMSFAQLREFLISLYIYGNDMQEVINKIHTGVTESVDEIEQQLDENLVQQHRVLKKHGFAADPRGSSNSSQSTIKATGPFAVMHYKHPEGMSASINYHQGRATVSIGKGNDHNYKSLWMHTSVDGGSSGAMNRFLKTLKRKKESIAERAEELLNFDEVAYSDRTKKIAQGALDNFPKSGSMHISDFYDDGNYFKVHVIDRDHPQVKKDFQSKNVNSVAGRLALGHNESDPNKIFTSPKRYHSVSEFAMSWMHGGSRPSTSDPSSYYTSHHGEHDSVHDTIKAHDAREGYGSFKGSTMSSALMDIIK